MSFYLVDYYILEHNLKLKFDKSLMIFPNAYNSFNTYSGEYVKIYSTTSKLQSLDYNAVSMHII